MFGERLYRAAVVGVEPRDLRVVIQEVIEQFCGARNFGEAQRISDASGSGFEVSTVGSHVRSGSEFKL